jgi:hypothetical protein
MAVVSALIALQLLGSLKGKSMTIIAILFAAGAYGELYVALGERSPWVPLFAGLALAFLSYAAARMADAAAVSAMASGSQRRTMSAISHRIARSLSVSMPTSSAT